MPLLRKSQIAVKIEDIEGTYQAPVAADLLPILAQPSIEYDLAVIERDTARGTLTMPEAMPSFRAARGRFLMELAGHTSGAGIAAPFDLPLRACGMRRTSTKRIAIPSTFTAGTVVVTNDTFTAAPSGATGRVVGDVQQGETKLVYEALSGTVASSDVLTFTTKSGTPAPVITLGAITIVNTFSYEPADRMLSRLSIASQTGGGVVVGDELVGGTSGARGIVAAALVAGGTLIFERVHGSGHFVAAETINATGGKTLTVSGGAVETQDRIPSLSILNPMDNTILKAMKGARGSWSLALVNGDRGIFTFDFRGCAVQSVDGQLLTWPGDTGKTPPSVTGGAYRLDNVFVPAFREASFDMQNQLELRHAPADSTGTGYESCWITGRAARGRLDPETVRDAVYAMQSKAWAKGTFRLTAKLGGESGDGNTFEVRCRKVQIETPREADRGGVLTTELPLILRGDGADELILHHIA